MSDGIAPRLDALLTARSLADDYELSGLSPQEINRLNMADYVRIRERAGLDPVEVRVPAVPVQPAGSPRCTAGQ